jgi:hypothetical protein
MRKKILLAAGFAAALTAVATPVFAASVNIVHGIDGRDLGLARELPVDIAVNGACALKGVKFKESAARELAPGTYKVTVHPANGLCTTAPVITQQVVIPTNGKFFSAVASLTSAGKPQLAVFDNTPLQVPANVTVRHLAQAGAVTASFSSSQLTRSQSSRIRNGGQAQLAVLGARLPYTLNLFPGARKQSIARLTGVARTKFVIINVVGSQKNGFSIVTEKQP